MRGWKAREIPNFGVELIASLLVRARAAAAVIRARVAAVVDVALAAVDVTVMVFVMNGGGPSTAGTCSLKLAATSPSCSVVAVETPLWTRESWRPRSPRTVCTSANR
ncbi:hypothetical protein AB0B13_18965 [Streptomyces sp. NPDC042898]|uniref:hypothetical protein n=1 Tax=unclassified Streptomyces TaxID=2593676 RepID=UPI003322885C